MRTYIYYLIWIVCIILAMVIMATILVTFLDPDSIGVKGLTAGAGIAVLYARKGLFKWLDRLFHRKKV